MMHYTFITKPNDGTSIIDGTPKYQTIIRYDDAKNIVTLVGDREDVQQMAALFHPETGLMGWRGRDQKRPIFSALGNTQHVHHMPAGEGQERFVEAAEQLKGKTTLNIPQNVEDDKPEEDQL
jgi:hypothetical protein